MSGVIILIAIIMLGRIGYKRVLKPRRAQRSDSAEPKSTQNMSPLRRKFFTVGVFAKLNTRRFFRDRLAIFFTIIFPVIFLFVFGGIFGHSSGNVTFHVGLVNQSSSDFAKQFEQQLKASKTFKVDPKVVDQATAQDKMSKSQIDATILLPADFGTVKPGHNYPSGDAQVLYTQNNAQGGQTITTVLQAEFKEINAKFVEVTEPFTATGQQLNQKSLTQFDYVFSGLLGFSIVGLGVFGPINVFPELKKQGILRRLHTTPITVWQYFTSTAISQVTVGLLAIAVMFAIAISVFHLKVVGNYIELILFLILSIVTILGIGLGIGGWAKNERQAAPLGNLVVFPMLFLSGTFFPRFLMPQWLQNFSSYLPLTPVIDGVRMIATEGKHLTQIGPQIGLLLIWLVVIYVIAFRVFRWE